MRGGCVGRRRRGGEKEAKEGKRGGGRRRVGMYEYGTKRKEKGNIIEGRWDCIKTLGKIQPIRLVYA